MGIRRSGRGARRRGVRNIVNVGRREKVESLFACSLFDRKDGLGCFLSRQLCAASISEASTKGKQNGFNMERDTCTIAKYKLRSENQSTSTTIEAQGGMTIL